MGINKDARRRANQQLEHLPALTVPQLKALCQTLGADTGQKAKGGRWRPYGKDELLRSIRRAVGRGTFAGRLNRFADEVEGFRSG